MLFIFWDFIISWVVSGGDYLCCWIYLMLRCIWFRCDFMLEIIFMHTYDLVIICRSDDYFLCIYLTCMIYCLIRNRALQLQMSLPSTQNWLPFDKRFQMPKKRWRKLIQPLLNTRPRSITWSFKKIASKKEKAFWRRRPLLPYKRLRNPWSFNKR